MNYDTETAANGDLFIFGGEGGIAMNVFQLVHTKDGPPWRYKHWLLKVNVDGLIEWVGAKIKQETARLGDIKKRYARGSELEAEVSLLVDKLGFILRVVEGLRGNPEGGHRNGY